MNIYGGFISARVPSGGIEIQAVVLMAEDKHEANRRVASIAQEKYPQLHGYTDHGGGVGEVPSEMIELVS